MGASEYGCVGDGLGSSIGMREQLFIEYISCVMQMEQSTLCLESYSAGRK